MRLCAPPLPLVIHLRIGALLRLQLPEDRGVDLLHQFQELEFSRHSSRVKELWASELYR